MPPAQLGLPEMPEAGGSRIFSADSDFSLGCFRRAKYFDHLKVGQPGRSVHGKDKLGKEPEPEGGRSKACQRTVKYEVEDDDDGQDGEDDDDKDDKNSQKVVVPKLVNKLVAGDKSDEWC